MTNGLPPLSSFHSLTSSGRSAQLHARPCLRASERDDVSVSFSLPTTLDACSPRTERRCAPDVVDPVLARLGTVEVVDALLGAHAAEDRVGAPEVVPDAALWKSAAASAAVHDVRGGRGEKAHVEGVVGGGLHEEGEARSERQRRSRSLAKRFRLQLGKDERGGANTYNVAMTPAKLPRVGGEDARLVAVLDSVLKERAREVLVLRVEEGRQRRRSVRGS